MSFQFVTNPEFYFGKGKWELLPSLVQRYGKNILLVTGAQSFLSTEYHALLTDSLKAKDVVIYNFVVDQEPSPTMVNECVSKFEFSKIELVLAIGGGSVLDAGKAISAMLPIGGSVIDYLEGVGTKNHKGAKIPMIAVPTTSGTGSEATKNAVLSEIGENGFKKSLRHQNFIPNIALVDPLLIVNCPLEVTAFSGMDAFTQLLESYLATNANPMTDALALSGLKLVFKSLEKVYHQGLDLEAREDMALASYWSGIALANAGLGLVHGMAGALGGLVRIPHGIICSKLMYPANLITVQKLRIFENNSEALQKYAQVGRLCAQQNHKSEAFYVDYLLDYIKDLTGILNIPKLSEKGLKQSDFPGIIDLSDCKNNPVKLQKHEMLATLEMAF